MGGQLGKIIVFLLLIISIGTQAQESDQLVKRIETYFNTLSPEKLYLTLDKPYYNSGDTIWFKCVLLNQFADSAGHSGRIYIDLINENNEAIIEQVTMLNNGLGYGDIALKASLPNGTYTLRAYTNWQQNFGAEHFFTRNFYIGNSGERTWLVNADRRITKIGDKLNLQMDIE
ncbi:MAG: hypothetical protein EOO89_32475, partial [Pedobacter sp.]